jgi:hypothetical protein
LARAALVAAARLWLRPAGAELPRDMATPAT